jgi:mannose-6-phosphate isomerase-like protein (cupin superfamily)
MIAVVPFTLRNLKEDLEDVGSRFDGAPDLEFRLATEALELERSGLGYQRVPPGCRFPYGHTHRKQEEVYVVLRGSGRMKLDDEIVELKEWDAVRVPPGTWRGYEAGPEGLEIIVIGAPTSARLRAKTSRASATGGLTSAGRSPGTESDSGAGTSQRVSGAGPASSWRVSTAQSRSARPRKVRGSWPVLAWIRSRR